MNNPQAPENATDTAAEAGRILARSAAQGSISAEDKTYLGQLIASRTGLAQAEAEQRIDQGMAGIKSAADKAKAAADRVRRATVLVAFVTAASLVLSAAAAWWAAGMGGRHRDEGIDFSHLIRWRRERLGERTMPAIIMWLMGVPVVVIILLYLVF